MTNPISENEAFVRLLDAMEPWLDQIVIIGGWAHRLYRLHPLSQELDFAALTTLDTDVAIPEKLSARKENLRERLSARGFTEEFLGTNRPPATHYALGKQSGGFYAEFLSPLKGGLKNRGKATTTVSVAGITSQKLRHLDLLLHRPWRVELRKSTGFPVPHPMHVQIPNAASYLAQKLLINHNRQPMERAKHVIYIHDTIQTFGRSLMHVRNEWLEDVKPMLPAKTAARILRTVDELFQEVTDTIRSASIEASAAGRTVSPDEIRAVCYAGLKQIFTSDR